MLALAGCADSAKETSPAPAPTPSTATAASTVTETRLAIRGFAFIPQDLKVRPGQKITVVNQDSAPHTATATDGKAFDTGEIAAGQTAIFTAPDKPGSYPLICSIHPCMKGTLTCGRRPYDGETARAADGSLPAAAYTAPREVHST